MLSSANVRVGPCPPIYCFADKANVWFTLWTTWASKTESKLRD